MPECIILKRELKALLTKRHKILGELPLHDDSYKIPNIEEVLEKLDYIINIEKEAIRVTKEWEKS